MTTVSTHVLDTASGVPASGIPVQLIRLHDGGEEVVGSGVTDRDGRVADLGLDVDPGTYEVRFDTSGYGGAFYPVVKVTARLDSAAPHYHLPLLLSPYGYTTYRGS